MNNNNKKKRPLKLKTRKNSTSSPIVKEKISSYFPILSQEKNLETINENVKSYEEILVEKPLPNSDKKINLNISDDSVFSTKEKPRSQSKLFQNEKITTISKNSKRKIKKICSEGDIENLAKSSSGEFNLEHLQLALAMSNSLQNETEKNDFEKPIISTQEKINNLKETLQQFGFKTGIPTSGITLPKGPPQKRRKKQIFRTTLLIRSEKDRKRIIEQKVNEILTNIATYNDFKKKNSPKFKNSQGKPHSFSLREIYGEDAPNYHKSILTSKNKEYFNSLVNPEDCAKVGSLLKDWHKIPGREKTPEREREIKNQSHEKPAVKEKLNNGPDMLLKTQENVNIELNVTEKHSESQKTQSEILFEQIGLGPKIEKSPSEIVLKNIQTLEIKSQTPPKYSTEVNLLTEPKLSLRSESPDLFSDDSCDYNPNNDRENLSPDIFTYENFNEDPPFELVCSSTEEVSLSKEGNVGSVNGNFDFIDLTQGSTDSSSNDSKGRTQNSDEKGFLCQNFESEESTKQNYDSKESPRQDFDTKRSPRRNFVTKMSLTQNFDSKEPTSQNFSSKRSSKRNFDTDRSLGQNFNSKESPEENFDWKGSSCQNFDSKESKSQNLGSNESPSQNFKPKKSKKQDFDTKVSQIQNLSGESLGNQNEVLKNNDTIIENIFTEVLSSQKLKTKEFEFSQENLDLICDIALSTQNFNPEIPSAEKRSVQNFKLLSTEEEKLDKNELKLYNDTKEENSFLNVSNLDENVSQNKESSLKKSLSHSVPKFCFKKLISENRKGETNEKNIKDISDQNLSLLNISSKTRIDSKGNNITYISDSEDEIVSFSQETVKNYREIMENSSTVTRREKLKHKSNHNGTSDFEDSDSNSENGSEESPKSKISLEELSPKLKNLNDSSMSLKGDQFDPQSSNANSFYLNSENPLSDNLQQSQPQLKKSAKFIKNPKLCSSDSEKDVYVSEKGSSEFQPAKSFRNPKLLSSDSEKDVYVSEKGSPEFQSAKSFRNPKSLSSDSEKDVYISEKDCPESETNCDSFFNSSEAESKLPSKISSNSNSPNGKLDTTENQSVFDLNRLNSVKSALELSNSFIQNLENFYFNSFNVSNIVFEKSSDSVFVENPKNDIKNINETFEKSSTKNLDNNSNPKSPDSNLKNISGSFESSSIAPKNFRQTSRSPKSHDQNLDGQNLDKRSSKSSDQNPKNKSKSPPFQCSEVYKTGSPQKFIQHNPKLKSLDQNRFVADSGSTFVNKKRRFLSISSDSDSENEVLLSQAAHESLINDEELNYSSYRSNLKRYGSHESISSSSTESNQNENNSSFEIEKVNFGSQNGISLSRRSAKEILSSEDENLEPKSQNRRFEIEKGDSKEQNEIKLSKRSNKEILSSEDETLGSKSPNRDLNNQNFGNSISISPGNDTSFRNASKSPCRDVDNQNSNRFTISSCKDFGNQSVSKSFYNNQNFNLSPTANPSFRYIDENHDLDLLADQLAHENVYNQEYFSKYQYQDLNKTLLHRRVSELKSVNVTPSKVESASCDEMRNENVLDKTPESKNLVSPGPELIIKTKNVTPMANYNEMDTPQRNRELDKFGLKPMSKGKSVKILEYLYNATHPVCDDDKNYGKTLTSTQSEASESDSNSENESEPASKRRKTGKKEQYVSNRAVRRRKSQQLFIHKDTEKPITLNFALDSLSVDEMIFEKVFSKKTSSCALPFHIAWHNFISTQPGLTEAILLYEPIQLEEIYMYFKNLGYKYHIQDIQTFLDRKCITIRTNQNNR